MDLTKIDKPFGQLDRETQLALFAAWLDGKIIQFIPSSNGHWESSAVMWWSRDLVFRVRPEPLTLDAISWIVVAPQVKAMARDADGEAHLFDGIPYIYKQNDRWSGGELAQASTFASYRRGTCDWKDSLVVRP